MFNNKHLGALMRVLFTILLLCFAFSASIAQGPRMNNKHEVVHNDDLIVNDVTVHTNQRADSKYNYYYDADGNYIYRIEERDNFGEWENYYKSEYEWHTDFKGITSVLGFRWEYDNWNLVYRYTRTQDEENRTLDLKGENLVNEEWLPAFRRFYTYNENEYTTSYLYERYYNTGDLYSKQLWGYEVDENGNILVETFQYLKDGEMTYSYRTMNTFDDNNNQTDELMHVWNGAVWVNSSRNHYTYDEYGNFHTGLYEYWEDPEWLPEGRETMTWDEYGNDLTYLWEEYYDDWTNSYWYECEVDENGNQTSVLEKEWNGQEWGNSYLTSRTFNANNDLLDEKSQYWEFEEWTNNGLSTYEYDDNYYLKTISNYEWANGEWTFAESNRIDFEDKYNAFAFSGYQVEINYSELVSVGNIKVMNRVDFYPNPSSGSSTISFGLLQSENVSVSLLDLTGRVVETIVQDKPMEAGMHTIDYNTSHLRSGSYYLRINNGNASYTKKIVVLR